MAQTVFPCITFKDAKASFDWLERALGAERVAVYEDDAGRVAHAELRIGESVVMAGDERADSQATPPGASVIYVVVDDANAAYKRAKAAGAEVTEPVDQDYGSPSTATAGRSAHMRAPSDSKFGQGPRRRNQRIPRHRSAGLPDRALAVSRQPRRNVIHTRKSPHSIALATRRKTVRHPPPRARARRRAPRPRSPPLRSYHRE